MNDTINEENYLTFAKDLKHRFLNIIVDKNTRELTSQLSKFLQENWQILKTKWSSIDSQSEKDDLYTLTLCGELLDHIGQNAEARKLLSIAGDIMFLTKGKDLQSTHPADRKKMRERIRLVAVYTMITLYKDFKYPDALNEIKNCKEQLDAINKNTDSIGTRAQLYFYLGMCHRKMHEFTNAEKYFRQSIDLHVERAFKQREDKKTHIQFSKHRTGLIMTKLAWMQHQRGFIDRAETSILTAELLFTDTNDIIISAYANMVHASVLRNKCSDDTRQQKEYINKSKEYINKAINESKEASHLGYYYHSLCEQALINIQLAATETSKDGLNEIMQTANEIADYAKKENHSGLLARAYYLWSDVAAKQGDYAKALKLANEGIEKCDENHNINIMIDLHIACTRFILDQNNSSNLEDTHKHLQKIYRYNNDSLPIEGQSALVSAYYYLLYTLVSLRTRDISKAQEYYHKWKSIEDKIEMNDIRAYATNVVTKEYNDLLNNEHCFFIDGNDPRTELHFDYHKDRLASFLIKKAYARLKEDERYKGKSIPKEAVAKLLNIRRPTLLEWEKKPLTTKSKH